jgi:hypothetical protein
MTPKEKAKDLVSRFIESDNMVFNIEGAKQCALIAVDEIINKDNAFIQTNLQNTYWQEVKQEIENL